MNHHVDQNLLGGFDSFFEFDQGDSDWLNLKAYKLRSLVKKYAALY